MIFKRILINNFGGLREKDIELTSGVNVLYGLKETEMNIVFIFVKSMFFGVPEEMQEKNGIYEKAGTEASREKYGGTIWFQHNGKDYRLTRETRAREQQQRALGRQHAAALFRVEFCKIPRNGRFSRSGIAGDKIAHIVFTFPDLSTSYPFFVLRSTPFDKNRLFVRFFVDKNVCSIYNHTRTKILFVRRNFPWLLPHLFSFSSASASSPPR